MTPLVLLHGFTGSPGSWDPVLRLVPGARAWTPALLGHGGAALRTDCSGGFWGEVDRLAEQLADLQREEAHLVGYSLGARLALGLLCRYGDRFCRATLIGCHPGLEDEAQRSERTASDEVWARLLETQGLAAFIERWHGQPLFRSQALLDQAKLEVQRTQRLAHDPAGLTVALRVLSLGRMPSLWASLPAVQVPVLLLTGADDSKFVALAERMAALLRRGQVGLVAGVGHNVVLEAPAAVAAALAHGDNA